MLEGTAEDAIKTSAEYTSYNEESVAAYDRCESFQYANYTEGGACRYDRVGKTKAGKLTLQPSPLYALSKGGRKSRIGGHRPAQP
jgi:hypothetical protein